MAARTSSCSLGALAADSRRAQRKMPASNLISGENLLDYFACQNCGTFRAAVVHESSLHVIEPEHPEDRGVNVVNVNRSLRRTHTDFVGRAHILAALGAAACHPHGKAPGIVIAAVAQLIE